MITGLALIQTLQTDNFLGIVKKIHHTIDIKINYLLETEATRTIDNRNTSIKDHFRKLTMIDPVITLQI